MWSDWKIILQENEILLPPLIPYLWMHINMHNEIAGEDLIHMTNFLSAEKIQDTMGNTKYMF